MTPKEEIPWEFLYVDGNVDHGVTHIDANRITIIGLYNLEVDIKILYSKNNNPFLHWCC